MNDQDILDLLLRTGHLRHPFGHDQSIPPDVDVLTHPVIERAVASYQDFMSDCLDPLCLARHGRPAKHDGVIGPATRELLALPRCGCCDYGPDVQPAIGTGSWKGCHDVGDFHAATVYVDTRGMPSFLRAVWDEVWDLSAAAYDEIGLRFTRVEREDEANTTVSFVSRASGWIGLAVVGSNESCSSHIWAKFLATYNPADTVGMWTELVMHELGHNSSLQHTRGGIMSPSIVRGLLPTWVGDPSESILRRLYGGVPIPGPVPPTPGELRIAGGSGSIVVTDGENEWRLPVDHSHRGIVDV